MTMDCRCARPWLTAAAVLLSATMFTAPTLAQNAPAPAPAPQPPATPANKEKTEKPKPPKEDPEVKLGRETHEEMLKSGLRLVTDAAVVDRVKNIGKKIADVANVTPLKAMYGSSELVPYTYQFFVVDDPDINAFSLPGGYIYINKGLLNYIQSDDELAGVLGHEIIHAAHHHVMKLQKEQSKLNNQLLIGALITLVARVPTVDMMNLLQGFQMVAIQKVNGFGQTAERDADASGLIISQKAGYNPVGMLTFMERLARDQQLRPDVELGIFRTHPPERERVEAFVTQLKEMKIPINRRAVTNILKVEVRAVSVATNVSASEVLLDKRIIFRTASADRAKDVADRLNKILDKGAQVYDVSRKGTEVLVMGETLFTITDQESTLPGSPSSDTIAETGYKNLRMAIYRQNIESGY